MNYLIVRALCPATCALAGPTTTAEPPPQDEAAAGGASRKLSDTTSWSGKMTGLGKLTAKFTYEYPSTPMDLITPENKRLIYRTHPFTTSISTTPAAFSAA